MRPEGQGGRHPSAPQLYQRSVQDLKLSYERHMEVWGGKGYQVRAWADAWARLGHLLEQQGVRPFVEWVSTWELYMDGDSRAFRHALGAVAAAWEKVLRVRADGRERQRERDRAARVGC